MAKKSFDISSTLSRNKETQLPDKIPLKKKAKNLEEVQEKVELIHAEEESTQSENKPVAKKSKAASTKAVKKEPEKVKLVRLTIDTPARMHKKLKIRSIEKGVSMRDYILQLLEKELNRK